MLSDVGSGENRFGDKESYIRIWYSYICICHYFYIKYVVVLVLGSSLLLEPVSKAALCKFVFAGTKHFCSPMKSQLHLSSPIVNLKCYSRCVGNLVVPQGVRAKNRPAFGL